MITVQGKYEDTKEFILVYSELVQAAKFQGLVTYKRIAQIMGIPLTGNHMGKEVGQMLGEVSNSEVNLGRPMLSSIAVREDGGIGEGFFKIAEDLGKISNSDLNDTVKKETFWKDQQKKVYDTWKQ